MIFDRYEYEQIIAGAKTQHWRLWKPGYKLIEFAGNASSDFALFSYDQLLYDTRVLTTLQYPDTKGGVQTGGVQTGGVLRLNRMSRRPFNTITDDEARAADYDDRRDFLESWFWAHEEIALVIEFEVVDEDG